MLAISHISAKHRGIMIRLFSPANPSLSTPGYAFFTFVMAIALPVQLDAAEYYVSKSGKSTNSGSRQAPFATIQQAVDKMQPADVGIIEQGLYNEKVVFPHTGTSGSPITLRAQSGDHVVITGADPVFGWTKVTNNLYKAPVAWDLGVGKNQLFIKGKWYPQARWPNVDDWERLDCDARLSQRPNRCGDREAAYTTYYARLHNKNSILAPTLMDCWIDNLRKGSSPHDGWPDGELRVGIKGHGKELNHPGDNPYNILYGKPRDYWSGIGFWCQGWWWGGGGKVTGSVDGNRGNVTGVFLTIDLSRLRWPSHAVVFGHTEFIDVPGEWTVKDGMLYLYPPPGVNLESGDVTLKRRQIALDFSERDYVHVEGLSVLGAGVRMDSSDNCTIDNCHFYCLSHYWFADWSDGDANGRGNRDSVTAGLRGINVNGVNNVIKNSSIVYSAANGIILDNVDNTVTNCYIANIDYVNTYASSIYDARDGCEITHSTFTHAGRSHLTGIKAAKVNHNKFLNSMLLSGDGGTVYSSIGGIVEIPFDVSYNWFSGCFGSDATYFYTDHGCPTGALFHHNVIFDTENPDNFAPFAACGVRVFNNTFLADMNHPNYVFSIKDTNFFDSTLDKKAWANNINAAYDKTSWKFSDLANNDATLANGSPAIDAGIEIPGITDGFNGGKPDLGAYESGQAAWSPGHDWGLPVIEETLWQNVASPVASNSPHSTASAHSPATTQRLSHGFRFTAGDLATTVTIFNALGRRFYHRTLLKDESFILSSSALPAGVHFVKMHNLRHTRIIKSGAF
ncbi:MAG: hypothetical protein GF398_03340 [Chitinivibrionales bacterium]|nr:hypothetical protein [Chitinivibrionales bacterium]